MKNRENVNNPIVLAKFLFVKTADEILNKATSTNTPRRISTAQDFRTKFSIPVRLISSGTAPPRPTLTPNEINVMAAINRIIKLKNTATWPKDARTFSVEFLNLRLGICIPKDFFVCTTK